MSATTIKAALNFLNERIDLLDNISKECEPLIHGDQRDLFGGGKDTNAANENEEEKQKMVDKLDTTIKAVEKILQEG